MLSVVYVQKCRNRNVPRLKSRIPSCEWGTEKACSLSNNQQISAVQQQ